ncbi:hypothetical protein HD553DRAFT_146743 [Filobasidium floriforme]|uniref:uncharacterized protein n=1 Tax=Filobasidium floriforme TaxID=5210 RepID=UPI001E8E10A5|nr:uncharacterized protein HD553DRAFT_146743 [Filobasidium floriforme]KAH8078285.1 hypothetical protein HD553DRAFT_146743 [Filobasidium floriforme]
MARPGVAPPRLVVHFLAISERSNCTAVDGILCDFQSLTYLPCDFVILRLRSDGSDGLLHLLGYGRTTVSFDLSQTLELEGVEFNTAADSPVVIAGKLAASKPVGYGRARWATSPATTSTKPALAWHRLLALSSSAWARVRRLLSLGAHTLTRWLFFVPELSEASLITIGRCYDKERGHY